MKDANSARNDYLANASQFLFLRAPSSSAYISMQRQLLQKPTTSKSLVGNDEVCKGCGTLAIDGWTMRSMVSFGRQTTNMSVKHKSKTYHTRAKHGIFRRSCKVCQRSTKHEFSLPAKTAYAPDQQPKVTSMATPLSPVTVSENINHEQAVKASSKKRAKARRDREGLQALLNQKKRSTMSSNFSLMDFMKT